MRKSHWEITCDNATQFKATKTVIEKDWKNVVTDDVSSQGVKWKFIVEFSPCAGGFYELLLGMEINCVNVYV